MVSVFDPRYPYSTSNIATAMPVFAMRKILIKLLVGILLVTLIWFILMVTYLDDLQVKDRKGQPRARSKVLQQNRIPAFSEARGLIHHHEGDIEGEIGNDDGDLRLLVQAKLEMEQHEQELAAKSMRLANEKSVFERRPNKELVDSDMFVKHRINKELIYGTDHPANKSHVSVTKTRAPPVAAAAGAKKSKKKSGKKKSRVKIGRKKSKGKGGKHKKNNLHPKPSARNSSNDNSQQTIYVHHHQIESSTTAYVKQMHQLHNEIAVALRMGGLGSNMKREYVRLHSSKPIPVRSRSKTRDERLDLKNGVERHSFNVTASEEFPLNRLVPDYRPASCPKALHALLPSATVIVCFHNEAWSTLLRTVYSVLDHTPKHLLKEIVLVDDASTYDYLGTPLEKYLTDLSNKLLLVRTKQRQGLIRARLLGTSYARGDVLVFLDSHCECVEGWVEPLLQSIKYDRKKVVCPMIDIIQYNSFEYVQAPRDLHGGFDWNMQFVWKNLPLHEMERRKDDGDSIRTPTMIGGIFAIDRSYFNEIGQYDEGMDIWGGENLELSFRIWQCGGSIEILPCSRVGHVFRPVIPYGFPGGARKTLQHNAIRVAEVWLDEYIKFFYATTNQTQDTAVIQSIMDRRRLRAKMKCNSFAWYLKYVIPEMTVPSVVAEYFGQIHSGAKDLCFESHGISVTTNLCIAQNHNQIFTLTEAGYLKHGRRCLTPQGINHSSMKLLPCDDVSVRWSYSRTNQLRITNSTHSLCVELVSRQLAFSSCTTDMGCKLLTHRTKSKSKCLHPQAWTFTHHFDQQKLHATYV